MTVKKILCLILVFSLLVVPVSAEYDSYYELSPVVSSPELFSSGVSLAAVGDSGISTMDLTTNESTWLQEIRNALISYPYGASENSVLGYLQDIEYYVEPIRTYISNLSLLSDITSSAGSILSYVRGFDIPISSISSYTTSIFGKTSDIASDTSVLSNEMTRIISVGAVNEYGQVVSPGTDLATWIANIGLELSFDGVFAYSGERTLYSRIKQLQDVLASDDDKALANSQKENREEIEDTFLSGSSGSTSLGASDFGALSDVGGSVKDVISLNGQSSVSDFTSGLAGADEAGQGWFSESTRAALDSVSSAASYSLRDDPYNMAGWQDRYAWVEGE